MEFWFGWLSGIGTAMAYWLLWGWRLRRRRCGVEKPHRRPAHPTREAAETRNFLYYDGTQMPAIKEEKYEKNR